MEEESQAEPERVMDGPATEVDAVAWIGPVVLPPPTGMALSPAVLGKAVEGRPPLTGMGSGTSSFSVLFLSRTSASVWSMERNSSTSGDDPDGVVEISHGVKGCDRA